MNLSNVQQLYGNVNNILGGEGTRWGLQTARYNGIDIMVLTGQSGLLDSLQSFSIDSNSYSADVTNIVNDNKKMLVEYLIPNQSGSRLDDMGWMGEKFFIVGLIYGQKYFDKIDEIRNILSVDNDAETWWQLAKEINSSESGANSSSTSVLSYVGLGADKNMIKQSDYRKFVHPTLGVIPDCSLSAIRFSEGQGKQQAAIVQLTIYATTPINRDGLRKQPVKSWWQTALGYISIINNAINAIRGAINTFNMIYGTMFGNKQSPNTYYASRKSTNQLTVANTKSQVVVSSNSIAMANEEIVHTTTTLGTLINSFSSSAILLLSYANTDKTTTFTTNYDSNGLVTEVLSQPTAIQQNSANNATGANMRQNNKSTFYSPSANRVTNFSDYATSVIKSYKADVDKLTEQLDKIQNYEAIRALESVKATVLVLDSIALGITSGLDKTQSIKTDIETSLLHLYEYNSRSSNLAKSMLINKIKNPFQLPVGIDIIL